MDCIIRLQLGKYNNEPVSFSCEPGTDKRSHWLNPLFMKCRNVRTI
jgi:hypothetical protein